MVDSKDFISQWENYLGNLKTALEDAVEQHEFLDSQSKDGSGNILKLLINENVEKLKNDKCKKTLQGAMEGVEENIINLVCKEMEFANALFREYANSEDAKKLSFYLTSAVTVINSIEKIFNLSKWPWLQKLVEILKEVLNIVLSPLTLLSTPPEGSD